ncbi:ATP-binding cassette domain-containing protein [Campylobacter fetus]|uniref:ATP-binding cassette domain-containing protein n=1 Tax=Campylobacter fetus TaxID=196 RepID=UPI000FCA2DF4|nr:ATP-binding cassette domain-containing protein [Campylobacter fetus]
MNLKNRNLILSAITLLSVLYSVLNLAVLAFINRYLLNITSGEYGLILYFIILLLLFFIASLAFRYTISLASQNYICDMRLRIIKRILDTDYHRTKQIGRAKLIALLSSDIASITNGFVRIPEILQGGLVAIVSFFYILYLSPILAFSVFIWLGFGAIFCLYFIKKLYNLFKQHRKNEDRLYKNYETSIDAHKEFSLNLKRAADFFNLKFRLNVQDMRKNMLSIDFYQSLVSNWVSVMTLGAVGLVIYLSLGFELLDMAGAVTISITILFLRAPLMMVLFAYPSIIKSKVAAQKIKSLELAAYKEEFDTYKSFDNWQRIELRNISFSYENKLILDNINMRLDRGECLFLIGENGSGKSTLFLILAGLLKPSSGEIYIDDVKIDSSNIQIYKNTISAVFSEFYLFSDIENDAKKWFELLGFRVSNDSQIDPQNLSQGQKKRLALINALLENRTILLLDEWAADQDPHFRTKFYTEILKLFKQQKITVFAISHDDRYFKCADRIYELRDRKLINYLS